jgi:hypothetical protein
VLVGVLLERLGDARVVTVLVVEDVHGADEATLDLLRFLTRRLGAAPVLVVVTYRDDAVGPLHPVRLLAGSAPVPPAAAGAPVPPGGGGPGRPAGAGPGRAARADRGEPLLRHRGARRRSCGDPGHGGGRGAGSGGSAVPPRARQVLDAAAVLVPPVEIWLLVEAAGGLPAEVDQCVAAGMLQGQAGGVGFRHKLTAVSAGRAAPTVLQLWTQPDCPGSRGRRSTCLLE